MKTSVRFGFVERCSNLQGFQSQNQKGYIFQGALYNRINLNNLNYKTFLFKKFFVSYFILS